MKGRSGSNRAICMGDRERAGIGAPELSNGDILRRMAGWSTAFLKKFTLTSRSKPWKDAAVWLLEQREGIDRKIKNQKDRRRRHNQRKTATVASTERRP